MKVGADRNVQGSAGVGPSRGGASFSRPDDARGILTRRCFYFALWFLGYLALPGLAQLRASERIPWTTSRIHGSPEAPSPYRLERAFPKLTFAAPLDAVTIPGTQRLVIVEHHGRLFSIPNDENCEKAELFADLKQFEPEVAECYGITFHPRFSENRTAFVWFILDPRGKPTREEGTRIARFRVTEENPPRLDLPSGEVIFTWLGGGHNGGNLRFGPDGMLYFCTGDASPPDPPDIFGTGQDIRDVLASVLRIDVDHPDPGKRYGIPKDNPFVGTAGARGEVWAYGFRNPWRMSFDAKTGALWVGDVGWELWEMIHRVVRGGNYGWSITEGGKQEVRPDRRRGPTPILPPVVVHPHEEAASITGGEVYYGKKLPELVGAYIYGDWQIGTFWALRVDGDRVIEHRELCRSTLLPVAFGVTSDSELLICDYGGGGLWRLTRNPDADKPVDFPRRLSETGLFSDIARQQLSPGVVPYRIKAPRWADHATAERWAAFPGNGVVTVAKKELGVMPAGRWVFPTDAVLAKTYSLEMEEGNAATRRRIETQILHYNGQQWAAYSYRWNDAQSDAELVPSRGAEALFKVKDAAHPAGTRQQTWHYFSRAECLRCHNMWDNFVPGFAAIQLDRATRDPSSDQLDLLLPLLGSGPDEPKLVDPHINSGALEFRARSYLHANCSTCHRFGGGGSVPSFMNIETPLPEARLLGAKPVQGDLGLPEARVIAAGDPSRSVLLYRMTTAGRGHMPYLGGRLVDDRGVMLVRDWIASLPRGEDQASAAGQRRESGAQELAQLNGGDATRIDDLLSSSSGALTLSLAIIDGSLRGKSREEAILKGSALAEPLRRDLFERFLPDDARRKVIGTDVQPKALLALHGEIARGKALFAGLCASCHRINGEGVDFGPDLSHIGIKYDRAALLEQIATPSKIIEPQWQLTTIIVRNGEPMSGFIERRLDDKLTLKIPTGERKEIAAGNIESTFTAPISAMPEGLLQSLTAQEAADLLELLSSLK